MWLAATSPTPEASRGDATLEASIAEAPLAFEPNAGRTGESVGFIAHAVAGGSLFLRPDEAILSLPQGHGESRSLSLGFPGAKKKLAKAGKAKVVAAVTYTPDGGSANTKAKRVKLVRRG